MKDGDNIVVDARELRAMVDCVPAGCLTLCSTETFFDGSLDPKRNLLVAVRLSRDPSVRKLIPKILEVFPFLAVRRDSACLSGGQQRILSVAMLFLLAPQALAIEKPWEELDENRLSKLWHMLSLRPGLRVVVDSRTK